MSEINLSFSQGFLFREKVVPKHIAEMPIKGLNEVGKVIKGSTVLIMGLTYKENVPDTRESPVREMVKELKEFGVDVCGYDPFLSKEEIEAFSVKASDFSFSTNLFLGRKALPKELYSFLAQVLSRRKKVC
jgi:UDP-glucose 6-dehydrogenase